MKGLISIYLDIFRFLAAVGVFLSHAEQHAAAPGVLPTVYLDHKLVIFFFVISGYVIAATASRPDRTLPNYAADRVARLSSVVIPALVLTYLLDSIGGLVSPAVYSGLDPHWQPLRFLVNFFYCQQIWGLSMNPGSNAPLWSLGYEFWYYALFAIWVFVTSKRSKTLFLLGVCAFIGPKILLLLPAWVIGALAFHAAKNWNLSYANSLALFVITGVVLILCTIFDVQLGLTNGLAGNSDAIFYSFTYGGNNFFFVLVKKIGQIRLFYSANYGGDNLFAVIVALHFAACALFSKHLATNFEPWRSVKFIRWAASHTFSLYVYHMPLLYFVRAVARYNPNSLSAALAAMAVVLVVIAGLSKVTEERYPVLRNFLRQWFGALQSRLPPAVAK